VARAGAPRAKRATSRAPPDLSRALGATHYQRPDDAATQRGQDDFDPTGFRTLRDNVWQGSSAALDADHGIWHRYLGV
jgi:hypothetical protein